MTPVYTKNFLRRPFFNLSFSLALFGMLHSTIAYPASEISSLINGGDAFIIVESEFNRNATTFFIPTVVNDIDGIKNSDEENVIEREASPDKYGDISSQNSATINEFFADLSEGVIGVSLDDRIDNPSDNLFVVEINREVIESDKVFLCYDLFGVQNQDGISLSVNQHPSTGGYLSKTCQEWSNVKEELPSQWMKKGENQFLFTSIPSSGVSYRIKNLRIVIEEDNESSSVDQSIIIQNKLPLVSSNGKVYVKGFIKGIDKETIVEVEDQSIVVLDGVFEVFTDVENLEDNHSLIVRARDSRGILGQVSLPVECEVEKIAISEYEKAFNQKSASFDPQNVPAYLETRGASIVFPKGSLDNQTEISIRKLRKQDIPPMGIGLVNVTSGKCGYRFTPDGMTFSKAAMISIAYDSTLIPVGYTPEDIRTFFFNTNSKRWEMVRLDTVERASQMVTSYTTHFTDYINGIIQVPESPQTSGFTTTMMNDIKAADPSTNITLISPPESSQTGDANISYPIKIPAGRHGMQPQLALQYSSGATGDSWVGTGWDLSVSSIAIDSRWGVPTFGDKNSDGDYADTGENIETEIYTLDGEQLMYPKLEVSDGFVDWMPHRHYEEVPGVFSTIARPRISPSSAYFTIRKQGSFAKIQRLGNSPSNYYWKVTESDGTIKWYGGKTASDITSSTAVLKNPHGDIVYWSLFLVEDVHGNNIKYYYESKLFPATTGTNSKLSDGRYLYLSKIEYTGQNGNSGNYSIEFVKNYNVKPDVSINARMGFKQIDPYLLSRINVKFQNQLVRYYVLDYNLGRFNKTLLNRISEFDKDGHLFYENKIDYYDDMMQDGKLVLFNGPDSVIICPDHCYEVSFPIPYSSDLAVFQYHISANYILNSSSFPNIQETCLYPASVARVNSFTLNDIEYFPSNNNLYLTHYSNGVVQNLCTANAFPFKPNYALQNPNFCESFSDWLYSHPLLSITPFNLHVTNNSYSQSYYNSNNSPQNHVLLSYDCTFTSDIKATGSSELYIQGYNSTFVDNLVSNSANIAYGITCEVIVNTDNGSCNFGKYNFSDPYYVAKFNNDFALKYPGIPTPTVMSDNGSINIYIPNTTANTTFNSIVLTGGGISNTYLFNICSDNPIENKSNSWKNVVVSKDDIEFGVNKLISEGKFVDQPISDAPLHIVETVSYESLNSSSLRDILNDRSDTIQWNDFYDFSLKKDDYVLTITRDSSVWYDSNGVAIRDLRKLNVLYGLLNFDIDSLYSDFQVQHRSYVKDSRLKEVKIAQDKLNALRDQRFFKVESDVSGISKSRISLFKDHNSRRSGVDNLVGKYKTRFEPIQGLNTDGVNCGTITNQGFLIQSILPSFNSAASMLGSTTSENYNVGGYLGLGIGRNHFTKLSTFGVQYNKGWSSTTAKLNMVDIDGDGLDDIVVKEGDQLYYKKHIVERIYDEDNNLKINHSFAQNRRIQGISNFFKQDGTSSSFNFQATFGIGFVGGFAGTDRAKSKSENSIYFTDANGDGLIDIVKNGTVFFNRLVNNVPFFEADSKHTENMVITAAPRDINTPAEYFQNEIEYPDNDAVRVWEAPADGTIKIENHIVLNDTTKNTLVTIEIKKNDPTPNNTSGKDAMINSYIPNINENFGSLDHILAGRWTRSGKSMTQRMLIDFNLSNIPAGSTINSAFLSLYGVKSNMNGYSQFISPATSNNSFIRRVTSNWSENGVTWTNQPTTTTLNQVALPSLQSTSSLILNFENINVTSLTQDIIDNPSNSFGYMINMANESQTWRRIVFASSENSDTLKHPKLTVQFTPPGGKGRDNGSGCGNSTEPPCLLFGATLNSSLKSIDNVLLQNSTVCNSEETPIFVRKGDRVYFRIHNIANGNPSVTWDPKVEYLNGYYATLTDQNGLTPFSSRYSDGFILSNATGFIAPGDGVATISWDRVEVSNLSDNVTFEIIKAEFSGAEQEPISQTVIFSRTCNAGTTQSVESGSLSPVVISGNKSNPAVTTVFYFNLKSNSNVNWKQIEWRPKIVSLVKGDVIGLDNQPEGTLSSEQTDYPIVNYDIYKSYLCAQPYSVYSLGLNETTHEIAPSLDGIFSSSDNGIIHFVIKGKGSLIGSREISVLNGVVSIDNLQNIIIPSIYSEIEIGFYTDDSKNDSLTSSLLEKMAQTENTVAYVYSGLITTPLSSFDVNLFQKPRSNFGPMYRQWGQFMYNPDVVENALPIGSFPGFLIKDEALVVSQSQATDIQQAINTLENSGYNQVNLDDSIALQNFENNLNQFQANTASLLNVPMVSAQPIRYFNDGEYLDKWIGFHEQCYTAEFSTRAAGYSQSFEGFINEEDETVQATLNTGAYGITKYSINSGRNISAGANIGIGSASYGITGSRSLDGKNKSLTDYADMNGDRYPDIISSEEVQMTNRTGGLFSTISRNTNVSGVVQSSESSSRGGGATGSYSGGGKSGGGDKGEYPKFDIPRIDIPSGNSSIGLSGNFSSGNEKTSRMWADFNGDGLSDLLQRSGDSISVYLNFGNNAFPSSQKFNWGSFYPIKGSSRNFGGGLGYSYASGSVEAGVSLNNNTSGSEYMITDMNGDGLMDVVRSSDNTLFITFNKGISFAPETTDTVSFSLADNASSISASANVGFTIAWVTPIFFIPFKFPCINANGQYATSTNKTLKSITDFDGDGYPDLLEEVDATTVKVWYSNIRRTNKLKAVHNPLGGEFIIDYKVSEKDYNNPNSKWVMSEVVVNDGYNFNNDGEDVYKKCYTYENGRYDRREREFYGFGTIKTKEYSKNDSGKDVLYRVGVSKFHNRNYFLKGLMYESYVYKGMDSTKIFSKENRLYKLKALLDDNLHIDLNSELPLTFDVGGSEGRKSAIALLSEITTSIYDLGTSPIVSRVTMQYDEKGRVSSYINLGDIAVTYDDYSSAITYHEISSLTDKNIVSIPETISVFDANGLLLRQRSTSDIDPLTGDIGKISISLDSMGNTSETDLEYDSYGNLNKLILPPNHANQRMQYQWTYDAVNHKNVHVVTDAFGYSTTTVFDTKFDVPTQTTDMCGNTISYFYDSFGRLIKVIGPNEAQNSPDAYTIKFEYFPLFSNVNSSSNYADCVTQENFVPVAISSHYDCLNPDNPIETYTFIDGLARPIQIKKDIEINLNEDLHDLPRYSEMMSVSGKANYDFFGRVIEQRHPTFEPKDCSVNMIINNSDSKFRSGTLYDEMDRAVKTTDPDGNFTTIAYFIASGKMVTHSETDQNGIQSVINEIHKDAAGKTLSAINYGPQNNVVTNFTYNAIGELISYTDADNLTSEYTYDLLGRKTSFLHPDNGFTSYVYDKAGNLIQVQTANLASTNQFINYAYNYNRLSSVTFPPIAGSSNISNVCYLYGAPGSGNNTGRLVELSDATGTRTFDYGMMGEVVAESRVLVAPTPLLPTRSFTTLFAYDSWSRLLSQQYPDGEIVSFMYDKGGNLNKITGTLFGSPYDYLARVDYDHFEQRRYVSYGNNTETIYDYSPGLRQLQTLTVKTANQLEMVNNTYQYDKIGNITSQTNTAGFNNSNGMGGSIINNYQYDVLNRLIRASGSFVGDRISQPPLGNDFNAVYNLEMTYSNTGRIETKHQSHELNGDIVTSNSYQHSYSYLSGTHRVDQIIDKNLETETYTYDLNGNLKVKADSLNTVELFWDEADRLRVFSSNGLMQHYFYDASGERAMKASGTYNAVYINGQLENSNIIMNGYTTYPNGFITVDANGLYTKHYYMGSQRIASRIGDGTAAIFEGNLLDNSKLKSEQQSDLNRYANQLGIKDVSYRPIPDYSTAMRGELEVVVYYYHPDHLGSNTFVTDMTGQPYQMFVNLPFGETMAEQTSTGYFLNQYKFNGKELDQETGLYHYISFVFFS